jgi:hypothetical protein
MKGVQGFPVLLDSGELENGLAFVVTEKLGYPLQDFLVRISNRRFSQKTII